MKTLYRVALSMLPNMSLKKAQALMAIINGDLSLLFQAGIEKEIPQLSEAILSELKSGQALHRAEEELNFVERNGIRIFFWDDEDYPARLKACVDAPLLFYVKGDVNLDARKTLAVVGTRKMTIEGKCQTEKLIDDLAANFPDMLIVSGLAYGVDICAHRRALQNGLPTLAVVAHGLNNLYPSSHRGTAKEMIASGGGILSEFPKGTEAFKQHFVQRNRIVAGLCDACVVMESPEKGGSLITAGMARDYDREVFAFPGRSIDEMSRGCNLLIKKQIACLAESAEDIMREMNWEKPAAGKRLSAGAQVLQPSLFDSLSPEENALLKLMRAGQKYQAQDLLDLSFAQQEGSCARHIGEVLSTLMMLEMKQAIISLPGGLFQRRPGY